jgi:hypothetical protein
MPAPAREIESKPALEISSAKSWCSPRPWAISVKMRRICGLGFTVPVSYLETEFGFTNSF